MNKKKLKKRAFIASLAAIVIVGTTAAFLTSTDTADNSFEIAEVNLEISESFKEDQILSAGQIIQKEPYVKNTGTVEQIFFVEVSVPCMETTLVNDHGQRIAPKGTTTISSNADYKQLAEIFDLLADGNNVVTHEDDPDPKYGEIHYNARTDTPSATAGWVYLGQTGKEEKFENKEDFLDGTYNTYLFGYTAWVEPDEVTRPVFDKLRLRSMVDAEITSGTIGQVTVTAYTIQKSDLNVEGVSEADGTAEKPYTKEQLEKLSKIIDNKNKEVS